MADPPLLEVRSVSKYFGSVIALKDISMAVNAGEVMCLLGDNGAGKSTLIKILSGVHRPDEGKYLVGGEEVAFTSPREALDRGIATVYQDLAMVPLMSVTRNFFMGREPTVGRGPFRRFDIHSADDIARHGNLGGRPLLHEHVLHVDDEVCGARRVEPVEHVKAPAPRQHTVDDLPTNLYLVHVLTSWLNDIIEKRIARQRRFGVEQGAAARTEEGP